MVNGSDDWRIERHSELPVVEMRDQRIHARYRQLTAQAQGLESQVPWNAADASPGKSHRTRHRHLPREDVALTTPLQPEKFSRRKYPARPVTSSAPKQPG